MPKSTSGRKNRDIALREAVKALSVAAKSLALASDALSRLYDTDDDDTSVAETDGSSIAVEKAPHTSPPKLPGSVINYEDSDDEYMILARKAISAATDKLQSPIGENKSMWSEMQNNFGFFAAAASIKGDTESEGGLMVDGRPCSSTSKPTKPDNETSSKLDSGSQILSNDVKPGNPIKRDTDAVTARPPGPKTWASLAAANSLRWQEINTPSTRENSGANTTAGNPSDNPKSGTEERFANLKNRWATPTEIQHKVLRPLRAGSDLLLLHANLKSHVHAILLHCIQTIKKERPTSSSVGAISVLVIVPQQTTGRLYLNYANELLSDLKLSHKALLLPGGGSDIAIEAERMSTERIDILISSPRIFVNHVNGNPNLPNHLSRIRFVVYAGAQELTKSDAFLSFQFNMIKKRMPTRAKSPRQIIIAASYMDDHIQVFANRGLHPGYITIYGADSDDSLLPERWENLLNN